MPLLIYILNYSCFDHFMLGLNILICSLYFVFNIMFCPLHRTHNFHALHPRLICLHLLCFVFFPHLFCSSTKAVFPPSWDVNDEMVNNDSLNVVVNLVCCRIVLYFKTGPKCIVVFVSICTCVLR